MIKGLLLVLAGLGAGFVIAWWLPSGAPPLSGTDAPASRGTASLGVVPPAGDASRLAALETALNAEIAERARLEGQVQELAATLADLNSNGAALAPAAAGPTPDAPDRPRFTRNGPLRDSLQGGQIERLLAAGFAPDRAEWIDRRTSELRMQQLQAQYDATREGRAFEPTQQMGDRTLRSELGDSDYERYLQALERPTSVAVESVLASSPGERSGLKPGDEVVAYDGKRVFDMRELNALTLEGNAGESVAVEVRRDGQNIQLVMPRGPIGIFGGGFRGR
jgi:membrane-associated protease RseP (regulator of RpoE activity)